MSSILRADLYRLFRSKPIYYGFILCIILPIIFNVTSLEAKQQFATPEIGTTFFIPMIISAILGLTIIHDFSGGGIKNKIIIGKSRTNIYMSWLISFLITSLLLLGIYEASYFTSAYILDFDMSILKADIIIYNILVIFFLNFTNLVFSLLIAFYIPDGRCIIIFFLFSEPPMIIFSILSSLYPDSLILDVVFRLIPQFQSNTLYFSAMPDKPWFTILCTFSLAILFIFGGLHMFNKKDLK